MNCTEMKTTKVVAKIIHELILSEPWLRNADGSYVSERWVKNRKIVTFIDQGKIAGFILYDIRSEISKNDSIFIHMMWVDSSLRGKGIGQMMVAKLKAKYKRKICIYAYANQNGQRLLSACGFAVGDIAYRECIYWPREED